MNAIVPLIISKAKEGSTWAGLAAIVAGLSFIPHAAELATLVPALGTVVGGLLAIYFK